eukprot:CAMPEP_0179062042 /NCGR_PEP_ID=MMETSP0796-20121207/26728_1 /TAXON_ID=73915 /ORGANISM="Pyrodinium bahamense, Strain pbaha01" /LENGTH=121 /DNA_ID=CAMNT_0020758945 /DNA_START=78 /DNA_END=444 /DNA_ORIENTATION=-
MCGDGAGGGGVHAGELAVGLHVCVVDVHLVAAAKVLDVSYSTIAGTAAGAIASAATAVTEVTCCLRLLSHPSSAPTPKVAVNTLIASMAAPLESSAASSGAGPGLAFEMRCMRVWPCVGAT